jgi:arsenite-transporting ATPase
MAVNDYDNLYAMELDAKGSNGVDFTKELMSGMNSGNSGGLLSGFSDIMTQIPGIDEATALFELVKQIDQFDDDVTVVWDTSPTGQTLNLLRAPTTLGLLIEKLNGLKDQLGGMISAVTSLIGAGADQDTMFSQLEVMEQKIADVKSRFEDPSYTTFVCVAIPEFLSLFETERLVQELTQLNIDVQNIVVNQILFPNDCSSCQQCTARMKMQKKYLDQMDLLYGLDFHLIKMPLLLNEIRGKKALEAFADMLVTGKPNPLALEPPQDE